MGFDFHFTCPVIDNQISLAKEVIDSQIDDMMDEACPLFKEQAGKAYETWKENRTDDFYRDLEPHFEEVRKANEQMRKEADNQITILEGQVEELKDEKQELEMKLRDLEE